MTLEKDTKQLLRLARDGQREAFSQLIKQYDRRCFALAYRLVGEYNAALDICQDSFVQAFRQLAKLRDPSKFEAWLTRIVLNRARTHLRQSRVRARVLRELPGVKDTKQPDHTTGADLREELGKAVEELSPRYKEVIVLYALNGYTHEKIAKILGKPLKTIRWRLHQARKLLRKKMSRFL